MSHLCFVTLEEVIARSSHEDFEFSIIKMHQNRRTMIWHCYSTDARVEGGEFFTYEWSDEDWEPHTLESFRSYLEDGKLVMPKSELKITLL